MQPSPELEAIVRRFLAARQRSDFGQADNLVSHSEHFLAVGSAESDWLSGPDGFAETAQLDWDAVRIESDTIRRVQAYEHGETGWVALLAERATSSGISFTYRMSMVFVLEAGAWKIVHVHFSIPVEDEVVEGGALSTTLDDLLTSVAGESATATRTATVVFTDIVGSTALSEAMGDRAWSDAVVAHFEALAAIVASAGGSEVKTLGDGGMYVFDTASAALEAASSIRRRPEDLPIRIGVHTGDLVAGERDVLGSTVAKAARVTAAADGGQVLVSATTAGMANPTEFTFGPPISLELKGLAGTHVVHELR